MTTRLVATILVVMDLSLGRFANVAVWTLALTYVGIDLVCPEIQAHEPDFESSDLAEPLGPPKTSWRATATASAASQGAGDITALQHGQDTRWFVRITGHEDPWFALQQGAKTAQTWMLTFGGLILHQDVIIQLDEAQETQPGQMPQAGWKPLQSKKDRYFLEKFSFTAQPHHWYRVTLQVDHASPRPMQLSVTNLGLYSLDGPGLLDYWLMLGASIEVQSFRAQEFKDLVQRFYPPHDPVLFNLSTGGWHTTELKAALPKFLEDHPYARYVGLHIGGNNVTGNRPYPGGADVLGNDLVEILEMLKAAHKIPILSRLTYRAYKDPHPVPPEINGTLPYLQNVVDPLIARYSKAFYDPVLKIGYIDGYSWFKAHPEQLLPDGIHLTATGAQHWQQLWVERAVSVVYGQSPQCGTACLISPAVCGNGTLEPGEACDEGKNNGGPHCTTQCTVPAAGQACQKPEVEGCAASGPTAPPRRKRWGCASGGVGVGSLAGVLGAALRRIGRRRGAKVRVSDGLHRDPPSNARDF